MEWEYIKTQPAIVFDIYGNPIEVINLSPKVDSIELDIIE